jgi:hypothetical protein
LVRIVEPDPNAGSGKHARYGRCGSRRAILQAHSTNGIRARTLSSVLCASPVLSSAVASNGNAEAAASAAPVLSLRSAPCGQARTMPDESTV